MSWPGAARVIDVRPTLEKEARPPPLSVAVTLMTLGRLLKEDG
jgi:hypothetical protein